MATFNNLQREWSKYRARLEREIRVLVVHDDASVARELERLLYRCHISARSVSSAQAVNDLAARDHASVLLLGAHLPEMSQLDLVYQLQSQQRDLDLVLVSDGLDLELTVASMEAGVADLLHWSADDPDEICQRVQAAVSRNVDRRMRSFVMQQVRDRIAGLEQQERLRVTVSLERRLGRLRRWSGRFECALVLEGADPKLRRLSERLLVAGMQVEAADLLEEAWSRIERGGLHLVLLDTQGPERDAELLAELRQRDPLSELVVVARQPDPQAALAALRSGVARYLPWPPTSLDRVMVSVQQTRRAARRERLQDSLVAALFWELPLEQGAEVAQAYSAFCTLAGMKRAIPMDPVWIHGVGDGSGADESLSAVLGHLGSDQALEDVAQPEEHGLPADDALERREHARVAENQFVRFRARGGSTSTVAYLGDLGQGGLFICTQRLAQSGTQLTVDVNLEHQGQGYLARCEAEVAWVAPTADDSPLGQGFGVRFIDPPRDVQILLQQVIAGHGED